MKVALAYDRVNKWGGAERVLLALHKIFPDAPLFTSVYNPKKAKWAKVFNVKTSFLQDFPFATTFHQAYAPLMPIAFESFSFTEYDLVISVTSEAAKGIITGPKTTHICYCLTPTRYLWSGYDFYFKNRFLRFFSKPAVLYLKTWENSASSRPNKLIAISREVKDRINKFYRRNAKVIYPSIIDFPKKITSNNSSKDYFLVVSRLIPYKRVDLAIKACNKLKLNLKIVGTGSEYKKLKRMAGPTIHFLGELTDSKLWLYYRNSKALIFPGIEDFGLVMAEAQAFGKPVIAFNGGGAREIVKKGITGDFFYKQDSESLMKVLKNFDSKRYNSLLCRENSKRFSFRHFKAEIKNYIAKELGNI